MILTKPQYNALNKALTKSHLDNEFQITQQNHTDCIHVCDENTNVSLEEGVILIDEALLDFVECYQFTKEDIDAYDELLKQLDLFYISCAER